MIGSARMCPEPNSQQGDANSASERAGAKPACWKRTLVWLGNLHRRLLGVYFAVMGPRAAYWVSGHLGRWLYRLLPPLRIRSEVQCRAALGKRVLAEQIPHIAESAFINRIWNLTDLILAERLLHPGTVDRCGGGLPEPHLSDLLRAQRDGQPMILLTAYYGAFDLLPVFLGYNGVKVGVVYQPHLNPAFDAYRRRVRGRSGCELINVADAAGRVEDILEVGGSVAIIADHHASKRGIPVTFLGLQTMAIRSVGLLACRYKADVAVSGIRRVGSAFQFEIVVADIVKHRDWQAEEDPIRYITERYLRGLETIILEDPTQYLWAHARWGEEMLRTLVADDELCGMNRRGDD